MRENEAEQGVAHQWLGLSGMRTRVTKRGSIHIWNVNDTEDRSFTFSLTPEMISRLTPNITKAGMESRSACTGVKPISLMMKVRYCCVGDGGIKTVRLVRYNSQRS